jgi:hypothetical protein
MKSQGLGGMGGLGGSFPCSTADGQGSDSNESESETVTVGKQPPEQPEQPKVAVSGNGLNGLSLGVQAGHRSGDDHQSPDTTSEQKPVCNCTVCGGNDGDAACINQLDAFPVDASQNALTSIPADDDGDAQ